MDLRHVFELLLGGVCFHTTGNTFDTWQRLHTPLRIATYHICNGVAKLISCWHASGMGMQTCLVREMFFNLVSRGGVRHHLLDVHWRFGELLALGDVVLLTGYDRGKSELFPDLPRRRNTESK